MGDKFYFVDVSGLRYSHDRDPDSCPLCHYSVQVSQETWTLLDRRPGDKPRLEIVFRCPRRECGRLFIGRYEASTEKSSIGTTLGLFVLTEVVPREPKSPELPDEVRALSPEFGDIYKEAMAAESYGLMQIAGVGYRKALEFLIKDYCIHLHPTEADEVRRILLENCINRFVDDPKVKECARRAVWLGNDETHYARRWADRDITDLKRLVLLTVTWIQSSELTKQYFSEMS